MMMNMDIIDDFLFFLNSSLFCFGNYNRIYDLLCVLCLLNDHVLC